MEEVSGLAPMGAATGSPASLLQLDHQRERDAADVTEAARSSVALVCVCVGGPVGFFHGCYCTKCHLNRAVTENK